MEYVFWLSDVELVEEPELLAVVALDAAVVVASVVVVLPEVLDALLSAVFKAWSSSFRNVCMALESVVEPVVLPSVPLEAVVEPVVLPSVPFAPCIPIPGGGGGIAPF